MFSTFYTFAKAIDSQDGDNFPGSPNITGGCGSNCPATPLQNRSLDKARAGFDRKPSLHATFIYSLPFGKGKKFLNRGGILNVIFGGYEISWIQMLESGIRLTFSFANSPYNYYPTFAGGRRPDVVVNNPSLRPGWGDFGGDRFNQNNINPVIFINDFAYPGLALGCPNVLPTASRPPTARLSSTSAAS